MAIAVTLLFTLALDAVGLIHGTHTSASRPQTGFITKPGVLSFVVAYLAGTAGTLSLTTSKSSVLIGVLISVTTIPAAANVAVAAASATWGECGEAAAQLGINLTALVLAGIVTLSVQRVAFSARRRRVENGRQAA